MERGFGITEIGERPPGHWEFVHDPGYGVYHVYYNGRLLLTVPDADIAAANAIVLDWRLVDWSKLPGYTVGDLSRLAIESSAEPL